MISFLFLGASFGLLVFSKQFLINLLSRLVGSQSLKKIYFLIFFPGVVLHEFSHFIIASLLLVPTGAISLFPYKEKMGSIQIAKTDPMRQALIGLAPTLIGTVVILTIFLIPLNFSPKILTIKEFLNLFTVPKNLFFLYLIFSINNTMFSSASDRRSWLGLLVLVGLLFPIIYLFDLWPYLIKHWSVFTLMIVRLITAAYTFTFFVNLFFILPLFCLYRLNQLIKAG